MKRGYMERNAALVPNALLARRQGALVSQFEKYGVVAAVVFGDVADADELHYICNLGPYWGNATCVLNREGERFLVTGMTARVNFWVSMMTDVDKDHIRAAGPKVNSAVAGYLAEAYPDGGAIGMVGEYFPADMQAAIERAGFSTVWMQDAVEKPMEVRAEGYCSTLQKGAGLMKNAFAKAFKGAGADGRSMQAVAADVEYACRKAGAMDAYLLAGDEALDVVRRRWLATAGKLGQQLVHADDQDALIAFDREPVGVGDLTSGLMLASLLRGLSPREAFEFTTAAVYEVMLETKRAGTYEMQLVAAQDRMAKPEHAFAAKAL